MDTATRTALLKVWRQQDGFPQAETPTALIPLKANSSDPPCA